MDFKRLRPCSKAIKSKVSCVGNFVVEMEIAKGGGVDERHAASVTCAMHAFRQKKHWMCRGRVPSERLHSDCACPASHAQDAWCQLHM